MQIFKDIKVEGNKGQVVHIDDSYAQVKVDSQIFWISREDLDRLMSRKDEESGS